jgi:hypothetical protein
MSATTGTISRINYAAYDDLAQGLRIQLNAAINPGNSGGPALVDGRMIGLVFGQFGPAENIGYVIPNEEVDAYLEDVKDGRYDGKPRIEDRFQVLENEALRARLGLGRADRGILVREPNRPGPAYPLCEGDVLVRIGDREIDNQGMVAFEDGLRLPFSALVPRLARDGSVPVRLIRGGSTLDSSLPVTHGDDRLIKPLRGQMPSYFVHGPLVFSAATEEGSALYARGAPAALIGSPLVKRADGRASFDGEELVAVTSPLLPHRIARGYRDPFGQVVKDLDGVPVRNLRHLVELLRDGAGEFLTIRFHGDLSETMVLRRKAIEEATTPLMAEHGIPRRGTEDVMAVWDARPRTGPKQP